MVNGEGKESGRSRSVKYDNLRVGNVTSQSRSRRGALNERNTEDSRPNLSGQKDLPQSRLIHSRKSARLLQTLRILRQHDLDHSPTRLESHPRSNHRNSLRFSSRRIQRNNLGRSLVHARVRYSRVDGEIVPFERSSLSSILVRNGMSATAFSPEPVERNEIVDSSSRLHESVSEMRVLIQDVRLSSESQIVHMLSWE